MNEFSLFSPGIRCAEAIAVPTTLTEIYNKITSDLYKPQTLHLRELIASGADKGQISNYKATAFAYATFSGWFLVRRNESLIKHSGYMALDLDHLDNVEVIFEAIIHDQELNPLLVFRSPSGNGIKVVVEMPPDKDKQLEWFNLFDIYFVTHYGVSIDRACKDVARACFLPHDPNAYIRQDESSEYNEQTNSSEYNEQTNSSEYNERNSCH